MPRMLSKSRIMAGRQCPRRLWLEVNCPELRVISPDTQRRFRQGHLVNDVVHGVISDGLLIENNVPLGEALKVTRRHLTRTPEIPLFEATFSSHRVLIRADLFSWDDGIFHLTEVKSSTEVKPYHLSDCAIQVWVIGEAGYPVEKTTLAHIDTGFVYSGDGDYRPLLNHVDVTEEIDPLLPEVPEWVGQCFETLSGAEPAIEIGSQCTDPFTCPFIDHCSPPMPDYPVTLLPRGQSLAEELVAEGIEDVRNIPEGRLTNSLHERIRVATLTGTPFLDSDLGKYLGELPFPRYYLDFETIQFAVPIWGGTRPYEQLPFQWSCHIEFSDGTLQHKEFLDTSGRPPMRSCAEALIDTLGADGPILMYSPFEKRVIKELAERFPDLSFALQSAIDRLVDLHPLIKEHYYHPDMLGSFSIKAVLPTVAPHLEYAVLGEIKDGTAAQSAFEEIIATESSEERRSQLENGLRKYCELDTLAMVEIMRYFEDVDR